MAELITMLAGASGAAAAEPTDPNFNQTVLLLHGDGTNGAQNNTFLDSSTNNFTITRNGNTTQGTFSPFSAEPGKWGSFFDGSGDYLSVADNAALEVGSGEFTLEAWVYAVEGGNRCIAGKLNSAGSVANGVLTIELGSGVLVGRISNGSANVDASDTTTFPLNQWVHVAFVRDSNTGRLYRNGVQVGTSNLTGVTNPDGATQFAVGRPGEFNGNYWFGYVSNVRLVKGTCVYPGGTTFTPPTAPLAAITNTSLLTCQSNRFVDNSSNAFAITRNGDVRVTPFSPFAPTAAYSPSVNGGSGYWDGSGDSLSSSTSFEASTSTSTFTIEGWIYPTTFSQLINIIGGMVVSSGDQKSIAAEVNTSGQVALYWFDGAVKRCTGNSVMQLNAWNYFAIVVTSNAIAIYVNKTTADTLSGTTTLANRTQSTTLGVGAYYNNNTPQQYLTGYLSNLRYSTIARTISAVPTAPFASDSDTRWLFNFTNAGIFDNTGKNNLETVGDAQIDTTTKKFGTGSMEFDGTGDWLIAPNNPDIQLGTGNFTIEFWVYLATGDTGSARGLVAKGGASTGWLVSLDSSQKVVFTFTTSTITSSGAITTNAWNHIAVVREGTGSNQTKIYIGGTNDGTGTVSTDFNQTEVLYIGANRTGGNAMNGFIDDFRITKGIARYTANFTPPAAPFEDQ